MKLHRAYAFDAHTKVCLKHGPRLLLGDMSHCFFPHTALLLCFGHVVWTTLHDPCTNNCQIM